MDIADSAEYKELSDNQKQLQKIAMDFGLSYSGSKHELKLKILKYKENSADPNVNLKEVALQFSSFPTNLDYHHSMAEASRKTIYG